MKGIETDHGNIFVLEDGVFVTDAGNIFGDTGGRRIKIRGAMHSVLAELGDSLVLLDAGFGPDIPDALEGRYELRRDKSLPEAVEESGHSPADVTHIVLSHLDPDHVGWALHSDVFENATVYVQRDALEEAKSMKEGDGRRLAVAPLEELVESGRAELLDGDTEVLPQLRTEVRAGHSEGHQVVWIGDDLLFTADLAPSKMFLDPDVIAGVDTDPEAARRNRIEVLSLAEREDIAVVLYHEPKDCLVHIRKSGEKFEGVPEN